MLQILLIRASDIQILYKETQILYLCKDSRGLKTRMPD
jgi:hypothetical protein